MSTFTNFQEQLASSLVLGQKSLKDVDIAIDSRYLIFISLKFGIIDRTRSDE